MVQEYLETLLTRQRPAETAALKTYLTFLQQHAPTPTWLDQWYQQQQHGWQQACIQLEVSPQADPQTILVAAQHYLQNVETALATCLPITDNTNWLGVLQYWLKRQSVATQHGWFVKPAVLQQMLLKHPPEQVQRYLGYATIADCLKQESLWEVYAALRFTESEQWMQTYLVNYHRLTPADFEERAVECIILQPQRWWQKAEAFALKKKHFFSHLKEAGVIFAYPPPQQTTSPHLLTIYSAMVLHYIYEVQFYSRWVALHLQQQQFGQHFSEILQGDGAMCPISHHCLPIIQQYHRKRAVPHPAEFRPHVMPEALHWRKAITALLQPLEAVPTTVRLVDPWKYWYTIVQSVAGQLVGLHLADVLLSHQEILGYHAIEDVWNSLFMEVFGEEQLEKIILQHLANRHINLNTL